MAKKIVLAANTAWYLANFRMRLAGRLQDAGYEVVAVAPASDDAGRIEAAGVRFIPIRLDNMGTNPLKDLGFALRMVRTLRRERPALFLGYTVKPNVYGGLACQVLRIPSVHNIAGLGTAFIHKGWLMRLVRSLYRISLRRARKVFFQNPDDHRLFSGYGLVKPEQAECLPGSGVDTECFAPREADALQGRPFRFLLSGRMLWDKGVQEFVDACRVLRGAGLEVECQLLGFMDVENRTAVPASRIAAWEAEGVVRYLGTEQDVRPALAQADCVVLPSYQEGTPRSLLEAASMGKPVITTDAVGCREVVDDGMTGYLCRPKDSKDLADKMRRMVELPEGERLAMGRKGRKKMVRQFEENLVIERYLQVADEILA